MTLPSWLRPVARPELPVIAWARVPALVILAIGGWLVGVPILTPLLLLIAIWAAVDSVFVTTHHRARR